MKRAFLLPACTALALAGCASHDYNAQAIKVAAAPPLIGGPTTFEARQFPGFGQSQLLSAATATLQDLGFTVVQSSAQAGILTGEKTRSAVSVRGVIGGAIMALAVGAENVRTDRSQDIYITIVAAPGSSAQPNEVRVAFGRSVTDDRNESRIESIGDPQIYAGFFTQFDTALRATPRS